MKIPETSHYQEAILTVVAKGGSEGVTGRDLRRILAADYQKQSTLPAFYDQMARMEKADFVVGDYTQERIVGNQRVKERFYRITAKGLETLAEARAYTASQLKVSGLQPEG